VVRRRKNGRGKVSSFFICEDDGEKTRFCFFDPMRLVVEEKEKRRKKKKKRKKTLENSLFVSCLILEANRLSFFYTLKVFVG